MIEPTAIDVLCSIEACFEDVIRPALTGTAERSAAATVGHLLRHLRLRLQAERAISAEDEARQVPLLARLEEYFASIDDIQGRAAIASGQDSEAQGRFQHALEASLLRLVALRPTHGHMPDYQELRSALRVVS